eukprot:COSAG02_NODE_10947_length_1827_cov_0.982639_3_plen_63_part_01
MADQVVGASIPFEKPVDPLWIAIAMRIEDLLPHTPVEVDLTRGQHWNPAASAEQEALLVVAGH